MKPSTKPCKLLSEASCHVVMGADGLPLYFCPSLSAAKSTGLPFISVPHKDNYDKGIAILAWSGIVQPQSSNK